MLEYVIRVLPELHELQGELRLDRPAPAPLHLATPTWVPGAYGLMKYGRDLFDVGIEDSGKAVAFQREGWSGLVAPEAGKAVRVRWTAAAYDPAWGELSGFVDHEHAVLRATRYLYPTDHAGPVRVRYELPAGWALHHPSGAIKVDATTFEYPGFAALLDAPVVCGKFETRTRRVHGVDFHHVFLDRAVGFETEVEGFLDALVRVAEELHRVFGAFPFRDYTYVFSHNPTAHWGLEHADSTMIGLGETLYIDPAARNAGVRVCAHELFHAWNVCRLKPVELAHASFTQPPTPDTLWVAEGVTRYYEFLLGTRAKEIAPEAFFSNVVNYYRHLRSQPASARVSALDSSRATFLNHNKYPGSINATIDYYDAGMLIAFELDVALRAAGSSLDATFSRFYAEGMKAGGSYGNDEVIRGLAGNPELEATLRSRVAGTLPHAQDVRARLSQLGFTLKSEQKPQIGLVLAASNAGPEIANVLDVGPAAKSGIAPGDVIQRVDGFPYSLKALLWVIAHRKQLELTVLRGHRTLSFAIEVGQREEISALTWTGTEAQLAAIRSWLGRPELAWKPEQAIPLTAYDNFHGVQTVI